MTFQIGKKYVPKNCEARGIITILSELNDGDFAYSFEVPDSDIVVGKIRPDVHILYKEYIPPPKMVTLEGWINIWERAPGSIFKTKEEAEWFKGDDPEFWAAYEKWMREWKP